MPTPLIGVIGAGQCDPVIETTAYQVGVQIAMHQYGLVCGGLGGVMEAASRGCQAHGGLTVGIVPQDTVEFANPYLSVIIPTGMGIMRNLLVVRSALGLIAVDGKFGTLSELAFALQLEKPVVGIGTWDVSDAIEKCNDPEKAVRRLIEKL
jgi:uncharacterized protein (TIGR00725 family)